MTQRSQSGPRTKKNLSFSVNSIWSHFCLTFIISIFGFFDTVGNNIHSVYMRGSSISDHGLVHCERGIGKVITPHTVIQLFAKVVQANVDQWGSMRMSVQPEGATWRQKGWWPSALLRSVCVRGRELRHTASCFSTWCTNKKCLSLCFCLSLTLSLLCVFICTDHSDRCPFAVVKPRSWEGKKSYWTVLRVENV